MQQHAANQHVHGAMITQQTHRGLNACSRRWSKRTRNVMQKSVLIPGYGRSSRFGHEADHLITPPIDSNAKTASVSAGQGLCGAPRRNRTGDPILTMEPPGTAVRTAVCAGEARPSGPKLSVLLR